MADIKHSKGMTYPEILIALVIFLVAATGIISAYFAMSSLSEYSTKRMRAVSDAQQMMERINSTAFSSVVTSFPAGVAGGSGSGYSTIVGGFTLPSESITVTYPVQTVNRLEITVTLSWQHRARTHTTVLSTIRVGA